MLQPPTSGWHGQRRSRFCNSRLVQRYCQWRLSFILNVHSSDDLCWGWKSKAAFLVCVWSCIGILPCFQFKFNPFDLTKIWPHGDYPLIPVGKLVLNKNPKNYFAEVEQLAFSPAHLVPGIEPSPDKMLQGRLFSYTDTHRHRLGANVSFFSS